MRKGLKVWLSVFGALACLAGFFAFTAGRQAPSFALKIKALAGKRPISDKSLALMRWSFGGTGTGPPSIKYRTQQFQFDEDFEIVDARFQAELKGWVMPLGATSAKDPRFSLYSFPDKTGAIKASVIVREKGRSVIVSVTDIVEPSLMDRVSDWWDGITGKKPAPTVRFTAPAAGRVR